MFKRIHFIAIGGSVMHNLALALRKNGANVSGSDDEIYDPAKSKLKKAGILPAKTGWDAFKITQEIDAVILGMHAKADNPELIKAKELNLPIYSFPQFIYEQTANKKRVVIAGSHGKTSITSMIMHVLNAVKMNFDYLVGAELEGFENMVKIDDNNDVVIIEGDEYLSSALEPIPKFLFYKPNVALISGIEWDHINVFPTFKNYLSQFIKFGETIEENNGLLIYCADDEYVNKIGEDFKGSKVLYKTPTYEVANGTTTIIEGGKKHPLKIFGAHNMQNLMGAKAICNNLGIEDAVFWNHISTFTGAAKRLQLLAENNETSVFKDFAHAPSKVRATVKAVKEKNTDRKLIACFELHTFSSFNRDFLLQYAKTMDPPEIGIIYYDPETPKRKNLPPLMRETIVRAFNRLELMVFTDINKLEKYLKKQDWSKTNLLMMSSGNFSGLNLQELANQITQTT